MLRKNDELICLARNPKKFTMQTSARELHEDVGLKADIRVVGFQIDTSLRSHANVRERQIKMTKQSLALSKIAAFTWGAILFKARHVYSAVVRPAMLYGSTVWHAPPES